MINETKFLGLGGAGSKVVDALMSVNDLAEGQFLNNNSVEMKSLSNYSPMTGISIRGSGTGRNREKAKLAVEADSGKIINQIDNDAGKYTTYVLIFSLDGGFGSGSFKKVAELTKGLNKGLGNDVAVNLVGIVPKNAKRIVNIKNTLAAYADILDLLDEGIIDSYQLIDNHKMVNESEFNLEVATRLSDAYQINFNELDINDARLVNNCPGYKLILDLNPEDEENPLDLKDAVMKSFTESCFLVPRNMGKCRKLGFSVQEEFYNKEAILDLFYISDFDKEDYNEETNIVVLGGMENPFDYFKELEKRLEEIEAEGDIPDTYRPTINTRPKEKAQEAPTKEKPAAPKKLGRKALRDLASSLLNK